MNAAPESDDADASNGRPSPLIERVEMLALSRGLTLNALMEQAGESVSKVYKWRKGEGEPKWSTVVRFCRELDVPLEYLAEAGPEEPPPPRTRESLEIDRIVGKDVAAIGLSRALKYIIEGIARDFRTIGQDDAARLIGGNAPQLLEDARSARLLGADDWSALRSFIDRMNNPEGTGGPGDGPPVAGGAKGRTRPKG